MTAPLPSPEEQAVIDRFGAAEPAPESLRVRVAVALWDEGAWCGECDHNDWYECPKCQADTGQYAGAAIAVMRGEL